MVGSGLIEKIIHELGEDADLQDISIDSTYIKVHKASAGAERGGLSNPADAVETPSPKEEDVWAKTQVNQCIGVSRGGRSTKIHTAVDALSNPIAILLTTGNTPDITVAEKLISQHRRK